MLNENIQVLRKSKGFSQQDLAIQLNVVRQTISKWEKGLSVPDADMLIQISEVLDTSVSVLLGESVVENKEDDIKVLAKKLEMINLQLAQQKKAKLQFLMGILVIIAIIIILLSVGLFLLNSFYLNWNYHDPQKAVMGVFFHGFEWLFVRLAPLLLIVDIVGIILLKGKVKKAL